MRWSVVVMVMPLCLPFTNAFLASHSLVRRCNPLSSLVDRKKTLFLSTSCNINALQSQPRNVAASAIGLMINMLTRLLIGCFSLSAVKVDIRSESSVAALMGRWKSFDIEIGPDAGSLVRIRSFKGQGKNLEIGMAPTRILFALLALITGNVKLLLVAFIFPFPKHSPLRPCSINWAMTISKEGFNSILIKPVMQGTLLVIRLHPRY